MTAIAAYVSERIVEWGRIRPDSPALSMGEISLTYAELKQDLERVAAAAHMAGLAPGEVVLLFMPQSIEAVICFFGLMHAGMIPSFMPLPSAKQDSVRYWQSHERLLALIQPAAVVGPENHLSHMRDAGLEKYTSRLWSSDELLSAESAAVTFHAPEADDIALLQHSSGTTALKKGVALSHRAITSQVESYALALNADASDVVVSWLPMYHDMGLIACTVMPLMLGQHIVMLDPFAWVANPQILFVEITRHRGTLTWLPNFAFELLAKTVRPDAGLDLSSMRAFINCSEPCKPRSFENFNMTFSSLGLRQNALQVCYAMAETVFGVTQTVVNKLPAVIEVSPHALAAQGMVMPPQEGEAPLQLISAGTPLENMDVFITDESGKALPENRVGQIELSGAFLFDGYYKRDTLTEQKFRNGRYCTNDLGFVHDGELYVLGRNDDLIIVHGRNYFAHEIEAAVNSISGLKPGRNVAIPIFNQLLSSQEVVLIAEADANASLDHADLKRQVKGQVLQAMGLELHDVSIVPQGWLLKTSSGKISRQANRDKYIHPQRSGALS